MGRPTRVFVFSPNLTGIEDAERTLRAADFVVVGQHGEWRESLDLARHSAPDLILAVLPSNCAAERAELAHRLATDLALPLAFVAGTVPEARLVLPADWRERLDQARRRSPLQVPADFQVAWYRVLFEDHPTPMWVFSPASGRISAVNHAACQIYGYARAEFLELSPAALMPTADVLSASAAQSFGEHGQPGDDFDGRHRRKDGTLFPVRVAVRKLPPGSRLEWVVIAQPMPEPDASLARLDRTQRLEGLGLLALGLAHDLNNILAPVLFVGPLLRASTSPEETARYVDSLEVSAQRGANLVRQIMALAQGATTVRLPSTLRHIVRDVIAGLTHVIAGNIRTEALLPAESWPAEIDPTGIYQVVLNLCRNACDAMPQGGLLRVELSNHLLPTGPADQPAARHRGPWLCLSVSDTGTGIPAPVLERMWEPFYSTKPAGRGTGVGLSGVRGIIDAHQGFIEVQTREGTGSCFKVYLPALPEMAAQGEPVREPMPRGASELVLLVEDDATLREMLGSVLQCSGYRVIACRDGVEAIVQYNAHAAEVALVLTDITMPQLNGAVLAQMLRKLNPALPILILTGLSDDVPVDRELADAQAAASDYAHKSIAPERLLEKVRALVESRRRG